MQVQTVEEVGLFPDASIGYWRGIISDKKFIAFLEEANDNHDDFLSGEVFRDLLHSYYVVGNNKMEGLLYTLGDHTLFYAINSNLINTEHRDACLDFLVRLTEHVIDMTLAKARAEVFNLHDDVWIISIETKYPPGFAHCKGSQWTMKAWLAY
jgi:hypothetical protein